MYRTRLLIVLTFVLFSAACQRLKQESTVQVGPGEIKSLSYDAPRGEQKVAVTITAEGGPVNAYLVLQKDYQTNMDKLEKQQALVSVLGKSENASEGTINATIPAKESFALLLSHASSKSVEVRVKAEGK